MQIVEKRGYFILIFSYRPTIINAIKKELPSRQWDWQNKMWKVPITGASRRQVQAFAQKHGFKMQDSQPVTDMFDRPLPAMPELELSDEQLKEHLKLTPYDYQKQGIAYAMQKKRLIIGDQPGLGKAQPLSANIATPNGFVKMGEICVGDSIIGSDGETYQVNGVFPQGERNCYQVTFNDGHSVECDIEHLWSVRDVNRRRRGNGWVVKTTKDLVESGLRYKDNPDRLATGRKAPLKWEIPIATGFDRNDREFVIDPYIMGILLGDGHICGRVPAISIPDHEIEIKDRVESILPDNLKLRANRHPACPQYSITQNKTTKKNPFKAEIERLGLNIKGHLKFIPSEYLFGSYNQRLELLRGLMDSDGSAKRNRITFHTCSRLLADGIGDLANSLGGQSIIREYDRTKEGKRVEFQVNIRLNVCPFHLTRKKDEWKPSNRNYASRYISSVEFIGKKEMQCISVTAPDHLYLTDHFIVTHNTAQAIATVTLAKQFPCLVICPASLKENWKREWEMWTNKRVMILNNSNQGTWHMFAKGQSLFGQGTEGMAQVFITNYESLKKYFVSKIEKPSAKAPLRLNHIKFTPHINVFKSVIIDESHRIKDSKTQQTKFTKGICHGKPYILALTGTPVVNKPYDLWSQLYTIDQLNRFGGYQEFIKRYCGGYSDGNSNLKELNWKLNHFCFYRREKKEVLKQLPDKVRQIVHCDIVNRREYNDALNDLETYLKKYRQATDDQVQKSMKGEIMVRIGILKNISARGKLNDVVSYISDIVESGEKIVVFIHLKEVASHLKKMFPAAVTILGEDKTSDRQRSIDRFQNDPDCQVIICSIKAAGVGITLTASSRVSFVELPWHAADTEQCEDRCHRIGQKDSVQCTYFLGRQTIDEDIYSLIDKKRGIADTITGASNDVEVSMVNDLIQILHKHKHAVS